MPWVLSQCISFSMFIGHRRSAIHEQIAAHDVDGITDFQFGTWCWPKFIGGWIKNVFRPFIEQSCFDIANDCKANLVSRFQFVRARRYDVKIQRVSTRFSVWIGTENDRYRGGEFEGSTRWKCHDIAPLTDRPYLAGLIVHQIRCKFTTNCHALKIQDLLHFGKPWRRKLVPKCVRHAVSFSKVSTGAVTI